MCNLLFPSSPAPRHLHSFPTRRSSDLWIAPYPKNHQNLLLNTAGPSWKHLFGIDELGRDYFTEVLYAGQISDRKSTRLNSSHPSISYAVFCLKKKSTEIAYSTAATCWT